MPTVTSSLPRSTAANGTTSFTINNEQIHKNVQASSDSSPGQYSVVQPTMRVQSTFCNLCVNNNSEVGRTVSFVHNSMLLLYVSLSCKQVVAIEELSYHRANISYCSLPCACTYTNDTPITYGLLDRLALNRFESTP